MLARQANSKQLVADDAYMLADIAREQGNIRRGEELLKDAQSYYESQQQKVNIWDAWITKARLQIAGGHAARTEATIQQAASGFHSVKDEARECGAESALIESYVAQGRPAQASRVFANSRALCSETHEYEARMLYKIRSIQLKAPAGGVLGTRQEMRSLIRELQANGWGQLVREARTALNRKPLFSQDSR